MIKNGILPDICTGNFKPDTGTDNFKPDICTGNFKPDTDNFKPSKADKSLTIPANLEEQMPFSEKAPRKRRRKKSQGE